MEDNLSLEEKKRKFDNGEIEVTDFTEEELEKVNEIYEIQINELKKKAKKLIFEKFNVNS